MLQNMKANRVTSVILILGLVVAILSISLGVSQIQNVQEVVNLSNQYQFQFDERMLVGIDSRDDFDWILTKFKTSPHAFAVQLENIYYVIDNNGLLIYPTYYSLDRQLPYPILKGRNLSSDDFLKDQAVALLGDKIGIEVGDYYQIDENRYEVVGISGFEDLAVPPFSFIRVISLLNLPEGVIDGIVGEKKMVLGFSQVEEGFIESFRKDLEERGIVYRDDPPGTGLKMDESLSVNLAKTSTFIYAMALLNTFNISLFWIQKRRREIGIRKAIGFTNADILWMLMKEMGILVSSSVIIAVLLQIIFMPVIEKYLSVRIRISFEHIYISLFFVIGTTILTVIIPGYYASKIQPADAIRG